MAGMAMGNGWVRGLCPKRRVPTRCWGFLGHPWEPVWGRGWAQGGMGCPGTLPAMRPASPNAGRAQGTTFPSPGGPQLTAPRHVPLLCPPSSPPSVPRLQEDQEETDMSLGDKCPGLAEGPDPEPKPRGLSESGGDLPGMGRVLPGGCCDSAGGRGSGQSSDPRSPVPEQEPGLEVSGVTGTPPWEVPHLPWEQHGCSCRVQ